MSNSTELVGKLSGVATCVLAGLMLQASLACAQERVQETRQQMDAPVRKTAAGAGYEKLLKDADALIKSGKPAAAYALLEQAESDGAGDERFDYLLGIAALDSGRADKATLALERVLIVNPNAAAARVDLARSYYQLGDMPRARHEFETALTLNLSAEATGIVQKYLDAIDGREADRRTHIRGYIEGMAGHDTNVNNSTSQSQVFVDAIAANTTLSPTNVKASDSYVVAAAGGELAYDINAKWQGYAGADLRQRSNATQRDFDTQSVDVHAGVMLSSEHDVLRAAALAGRLNLGAALNSESTGVKGDWQHKFSPSNHLNIFLLHAKYSFAEVAMQPNDYVRDAIGAGWRHMLGDGKSALSGSLYYGTEQDVSTLVTAATPDGGRTDGAKRFGGLRFGGQTAVTDKTTLFLSIGEQVGHYSKINPLFLRQRSDSLLDVEMGANWRWDRLWTLRAQLNYAKNDSNIAIYEYDRMDVALAIRRDFR